MAAATMAQAHAGWQQRIDKEQHQVAKALYKKYGKNYKALASKAEMMKLQDGKEGQTTMPSSGTYPGPAIANPLKLRSVQQNRRLGAGNNTGGHGSTRPGAVPGVHHNMAQHRQGMMKNKLLLDEDREKRKGSPILAGSPSSDRLNAPTVGSMSLQAQKEQKTAGITSKSSLARKTNDLEKIAAKKAHGASASAVTLGTDGLPLSPQGVNAKFFRGESDLEFGNMDRIRLEPTALDSLMMEGSHSATAAKKASPLGSPGGSSGTHLITQQGTQRLNSIMAKAGEQFLHSQGTGGMKGQSGQMDIWNPVNRDGVLKSFKDSKKIRVKPPYEISSSGAPSSRMSRFSEKAGSQRSASVAGSQAARSRASGSVASRMSGRSMSSQRSGRSGSVQRLNLEGGSSAVSGSRRYGSATGASGVSGTGEYDGSSIAGSAGEQCFHDEIRSVVEHEVEKLIAPLETRLAEEIQRREAAESKLRSEAAARKKAAGAKKLASVKA